MKRGCRAAVTAMHYQRVYARRHRARGVARGQQEWQFRNKRVACSVDAVAPIGSAPC
jgi:hypothetical protein